MTSAARQPDRPSVPRGAAVRFPFPPALFAVPLAAALGPPTARVIRLPLPGAGSAALTRVVIAVGAAGIALGASGVAAVLRQRTTVVKVGHPSGDPAGHHRALPRESQPDVRGAGRGPGRRRRPGDRLRRPLAAAAVGMLATIRLVIEPEEDYLAARFGDEYARYRSKVRRWL